jgi:hypothetical protein
LPPAVLDTRALRDVIAARTYGRRDCVTVATHRTVLPKPQAKRERKINLPPAPDPDTHHTSPSPTGCARGASPHVPDTRSACGDAVSGHTAVSRVPPRTRHGGVVGMGMSNHFGFSQRETTLNLQPKRCLLRATLRVTTVHGPSRIAVLGNLHRQSRNVTVVGRLPIPE